MRVKIRKKGKEEKESSSIGDQLILSCSTKNVIIIHVNTGIEVALPTVGKGRCGD